VDWTLTNPRKYTGRSTDLGLPGWSAIPLHLQAAFHATPFVVAHGWVSKPQAWDCSLAEIDAYSQMRPANAIDKERDVEFDHYARRIVVLAGPALIRSNIASEKVDYT
jgi:hypothetical protein